MEDAGPQLSATPKAPPTVIFSRIPQEETTLSAAYETQRDALTKLGIPFTLLSSVYDITAMDTEIATLRSIPGDLIFIGWHYPRALKWVLARHGLEVNGTSRALHVLDARFALPDSGLPANSPANPEALAQKVRGILDGTASAVVPKPTRAKGKRPPTHPAGYENLDAKQRAAQAEIDLPAPINAADSRRWYPVIDYDICTNCMECLDFCLFGVYGVDHDGTLRTVQQDQCRQDCPACSRVCPVGAIIFPKYPTNQAIAGAEDGGDRGEVKLDLSKIFGKPKARHVAALERDRELIKAGRQPASAQKIEKLGEAFDNLKL